MTRKPKSDYVILTVTNALRLLEAFHDREEIGVAELARRLDLHKNNVFRLLATLEQGGYIEQSPNERYRLGLRCHLLGQAFLRGHPLLARARAGLERLASVTGETAHLAVLDPQCFRVVHLDGEAPRREIAAGLRIGRATPLHCTALGKALLGCAPEARWRDYDRQVVGGDPLPALTPRTLRDPDKFFEDLRSVAARGHAFDFEEFEEGLACVAAPVHAPDGGVVAAVSVSAPLFRHGEDGVAGGLRAAVAAAAEDLSQSLGGSAGSPPVA